MNAHLNRWCHFDLVVKTLLLQVLNGLILLVKVCLLLLDELQCVGLFNIHIEAGRAELENLMDLGQILAKQARLVVHSRRDIMPD